MARIIVSSRYGTPGDFLPMMGLAEALADQGAQVRRPRPSQRLARQPLTSAAQVTLITDQLMAPRAERLRPKLKRLILLGDEAGTGITLTDPAVSSDPVQVFAYWLAQLPKHYQLLRELVAEEAGTLVVGHQLDFAVRILEETTHTGCATVILSPFSLRSSHPDHEPSSVAGLHLRRWMPRCAKSAAYRAMDALGDLLAAPQINAFRASLGLPSVSRIFHRWYLCKGPTLALWPHWLAPAPPDFPSRLRICGFPFTDAATGGRQLGEASLRQLPSGLADFVEDCRANGRPIVVVTLGTAPPLHAADILRAVLGACSGLGTSAVLLCPHHCLPRGWGDACHACHCEYAPFGAILQHASVFVGNGGIGGFSQAVRAGVPMLVIPSGWDQPHNGWLAERLGVGAMVDWAGDGGALPRALTRLLSSPAVRERCAELRVTADDGEAGCERAAWHVLDWAQRRQNAPATEPDS